MRRHPSSYLHSRFSLYSEVFWRDVMARNNAIITITKIILTRQGLFWPTMGYIRLSDAALGYSSALRL
jgi:hypothetical protein